MDVARCAGELGQAFASAVLIVTMGVARAHASPFAYIPAADGIWVIDTETDEVTTVIAHDAPVVASDQPGLRAYVSARVAEQSVMYVIDPATQLVAATFPIATSSFAAIAKASGDRLYVIDSEFDADSRGSVSMVDPISGVKIERIPVGRFPVSIAATPDGGHVVVANSLPDGELLPCRTSPVFFCSFSLSIIDVATNSERRPQAGAFFKPAENPGRVAVDASDIVYVLNQALDTVPPDHQNEALFPALLVFGAPSGERNIRLGADPEAWPEASQ